MRCDLGWDRVKLGCEFFKRTASEHDELPSENTSDHPAPEHSRYVQSILHHCIQLKSPPQGKKDNTLVILHSLTQLLGFHLKHGCPTRLTPCGTTPENEQ